MQVGGIAERIELKPETDEEKASLQKALDGKGMLYWGDSDSFERGAFIINTVGESEGYHRPHVADAPTPPEAYPASSNRSAKAR